jgi:hypothetical protein
MMRKEECCEGVNNSNSVIVLLKIFERGKTFFFETDKIINTGNTYLVFCENVINFRHGDIDYVCGILLFF